MNQNIKNLPSTRTILITGCENNTEYEILLNKLPSDKLLENYTISNTNVLFITFFDIRDSLNFFQNFRDSFKNDENCKFISNLNFNFTISKYEIPKPNEEVSEKNKQSSLIIFFKNVDIDCQDSTVIKFLGQFGEVKEIRLSKPNQKILEFYDLRDTKKAIDALDNSPFGQGHIRIKYVWDTMQIMRTELMKRTDEILKVIFKRKGVDLDETVKKIKQEENKLKINSSLNIFLNLFDHFIIKNLDEIENNLKKRNFY